MRTSISRRVATSYIIGLAVCTVVHSLGGRVFRPGQGEEDRKFVTDPSAKVDGIFKKEGDMTFIMHSDPFDDDFEDSSEAQEDDKRKKRNAILNNRYLWSGAVVPYEISSVFGDKDRTVILSAMRHWEEKTCIRFRPKQPQDAYYVFIMTGETGVCRSFVGRLSQSYQPQGLTLGQYCVYFPTVVHELGHAIGFYHEHNRPDRDKHIEVIYGNILRGLESAFDKIQPGRSNLLGYGYDYASIMHYSKSAFSANGRNTIRTKDSTIPFGNAGELSPLDIAKANKLYSCGPNNTWPPISTVIPTVQLSLPSGISCGNVSNGALSGSFTTPGFPSYRHNLHCAYVIKVPKGYYIKITLNNFAIEQSTGCTKDYVQFYYGNELTSSNLVRFSGTSEGRICDNRGYNLIYTIFNDVVTVLFHTDASGSGRRGLNITFTAVDEDECQSSNNCHECRNLPGGFECICREGYYHSAAAGTCYDVNECAYDNGGCQHMCMNSGGSYQCMCNSGYYLQPDGKSCATTPPTQPPTTPPPSVCGGLLNTESGSFQTPNWPETYPVNIDCEWKIELPDRNKLVEIICNEDPFGIAGALPECPKDHLKIYDGHSKQDIFNGPFCHLTKPDSMKMSSNLAMAVFHAGPTHNPSRKGFKCTFRSVNVPTPPPTLPPTDPPTTPSTPASQCGGTLRTASGSIQTPNWPETYPVDIDCTWTIELPDSSKRVEITFEVGFGIAGKLPSCDKDHLHIYDGSTGTKYGPFCYWTTPNVPVMTSNRARLVFHAGPAHSPSRRGFKANYRSV